MPLYRVSTPDVWGNAVEGYEVNDQRAAGEVYVRPGTGDEELVGVLIDAGHLRPAARQAFRDGALQVDAPGFDGDVTITENDPQWAAVDPEAAEQRWLGASSRAEAEAQLEEGEEAEEVVGERPILLLSALEGHPQGAPVWSGVVDDATVEVFRGAPNFRRVVVAVASTAHWTVGSADTFEVGLGDWLHGSLQGELFHPGTGEPLRLSDAQEAEALLDYWEQTPWRRDTKVFLHRRLGRTFTHKVPRSSSTSGSWTDTLVLDAHLTAADDPEAEGVLVMGPGYEAHFVPYRKLLQDAPPEVRVAWDAYQERGGEPDPLFVEGLGSSVSSVDEGEVEGRRTGNRTPPVDLRNRGLLIAVSVAPEARPMVYDPAYGEWLELGVDVDLDRRFDPREHLGEGLGSTVIDGVGYQVFQAKGIAAV